MKDYELYKVQLVQDLDSVTRQLESIAIFDTQSGDWIIRTNDIDQTEADGNNQADASEEADGRISILSELENRYRLIQHALQKFEHGTYGICELSGEVIEERRLIINPAARTCTHHLEEEAQLSNV